MRRILAVLACLLLLLCGAAVAEPDEPALKNPKDRYEIYFEQTDGSEQGVFLLVDSMNDEAADVQQYGSVIAHHSFMIDGEAILEMEIILQDSEFGKMIIADMGDGNTVYTLKDVAYGVAPGAPAARVDGFADGDFDWYWESYHFPYGRLEMMHGIRLDDAGNTYMLIKSDETMTFEFAMGADMRIEQLRVYDHTGEDEMVLGLLVDYSVGPAVEIPADVQALMQEDFSAE